MFVVFCFATYPLPAHGSPQESPRGSVSLSARSEREEGAHRIAGESKLFSVIGGFTNLKTLTDCVLAAFVAGAVIAVLKMLYMCNLRISLFKAQVFLRELFSGKFSSYRNGWVQEQNLMHFSVAVLLGMLSACLEL